MTDSYHLRLLGQFELISPAGANVGFATKKAAALLAFLARQPGYRASRERLAALLWESDDAQALQSLRSALSSVRKATDPGLLLCDNDVVLLAPKKLTIDVSEFERCVAAGSEDSAALIRAGELYKGDFLQDFSVRNASDFAEWAEVERHGLRTIALETLSTLAEQLTIKGASAEAGIRAALQVIALDPFQERAHRALMHLHVRQGRHSAAMKQYHSLSEKLQSELGVAPEPATQELFYQITADRRAPAAEFAKPNDPVCDSEEAALSIAPSFNSVLEQRENAALGAQNPQLHKRKRTLIGAAMLGATLVAGAISLNSVYKQKPNIARTAEVAQLPDKSVAVLPFASFSSEPDTGLFADGLTEELINSLARFPDLKIPGRTSSFYFKDRNSDLREIGRKLGVSYVIEGSVRQSGKQLRVTAQLVNVKDGFHLWSQTYDRTFDNAFSIQSDIADDVAGALNVQLATAAKQRTPHSPKAYRTYLVAKAHLANRGLAEMKTARALFARLVAAEPDNAMAHAGYAMASLLLASRYLDVDPGDALRTGRVAIERALRLDPLSSDAYIAKGIYHRSLALYTTQPAHQQDALQAFRRAVQLAPRDPRALGWYGLQLALLDQPAAAIHYLEQSALMDPLDRSTQLYLGHAFRQAGRLDDALLQYKSVSDLFPDFAPAKIEVARTLITQSRLDEAEPWLNTAVRMKDGEGYKFELSLLYANLNMKDKLKQVILINSGPAYNKFSQATYMLLDKDYNNLLDFSERYQTIAPINTWQQLIIIGSVLSGDYQKASRRLRRTIPGLFESTPSLDDQALEWAPLIANVLNHTGEKALAQRILLGVLATTVERTGVYQPMSNRIIRVLTLAELGEREDALDELQRAVDLGYRTPVNRETYIHISEHPSVSGLRNDPRFLAMLHRIDRDIARMRTLVLARQEQPVRSERGNLAGLATKRH